MDVVAALKKPKDRKLSPLNPANNVSSQNKLAANPGPKFPKVYYHTTTSTPELTQIWTQPINSGPFCKSHEKPNRPKETSEYIDSENTERAAQKELCDINNSIANPDMKCKDIL